MTGRMLEKIEEILSIAKPDWVLIYGDTNSTLSGALNDNRSVCGVEDEPFEKYGSGIKRVLEAFSEYDLPQPVFEEIQKGFKVTVFKTTQKTRTRDQLLALLSKNPNMTREDLARALAKSPNTRLKAILQD